MMCKKSLLMVVALAVAGVGLKANASFPADDHVLYFQLDDPLVDCGSDDGTQHVSTLQRWGKLDSARVAAQTEGGEKIYLDLYFPTDPTNPSGSSWVVDPTAEPRLDTTEVIGGYLDGGYARASLESTLGSQYASYSFAVELGRWGGDDGNEWLLAAVSSWEDFESIKEHVAEEVYYAGVSRWMPSGFVAVPEPTSGLLMLLGGALLALRRKRRVVEDAV